ncbi:MAG: hypothetical protein NVSMB7_10750 [Chitinophagaceae bacterium]
MANGIEDLAIRKIALEMVREGLVCHTNLKNKGRLRNAEKRSFILTSGIFIF